MDLVVDHEGWRWREISEQASHIEAVIRNMHESLIVVFAHEHSLASRRTLVAAVRATLEDRIIPFQTRFVETSPSSVRSKRWYRYRLVCLCE